jgi:DNA-binding beta-propeller fold protein YncE
MHFCAAIAVNRSGGVAALGASPRNTVFVWGPGSSGNAKPARRIAGGATKLAYPDGIAFDAGGNMFVTNKGALPAGQSITVYGPNANGNAAPLRSIGGSETALKDPKGIAIGPNGGRIYVTSDSGSTTGRPAILVFPVNARGNVRPIAEITGPQTGLRLPRGLAIDAAGFIYVGNNTGLGGGNGWITVYKPGSTGDVEPVQTIKGSNVDVNGYIAVR